MSRIKAFPVYRMRRGPQEGVEAVEHPDTGKWWFRHIQRKTFSPFGGQAYYGWGPWECPANQPAEPYKGMRRREGAFAMLPA